MLLCSTQRVDDWYEARRGRITASLAAACIGLDPHKGPLAAFNEIVGLTEKGGPNRHQAWGIEFEQSAREFYEIETGNLVSETGFWVHDSFSWLGASPDGLVGSDGLLEVKCPSEQNIPTEPPAQHIVQMIVQMAVIGRSWCDYLAWCQTKHFSARVERKEEVEQNILRRLKEFYEQHIVTGKAPSRKRPKVA